MQAGTPCGRAGRLKAPAETTGRCLPLATFLLQPYLVCLRTGSRQGGRDSLFQWGRAGSPSMESGGKHRSAAGMGIDRSAYCST